MTKKKDTAQAIASTFDAAFVYFDDLIGDPAENGSIEEARILDQVKNALRSAQS